MVLKTSRIVIDIDPASEIVLSSKKPCFITLWHGRILVFPKIMAKYGEFIVLTSAHNDGQYIDKFISLYGHKTIRGSTYRGGLLATKDIIKNIHDKNRIVITPDGPRGPKWKINSVVTNIAARFDIPIIHVSFSSTKVKILNAWDKFMIPMPFAQILIKISSPDFFETKDDIRLENMMVRQSKDLDSQCGLQL
jgi:lysophospholipid acyltransferase (LPLAT)-like uncharacterized protein